MPIEPREVWCSLPELLRKTIAEDIGSSPAGDEQMGSELVKPDHLQRKQWVCAAIRRPHQVIHQSRKLKLWCALSQRVRELG